MYCLLGINKRGIAFCYSSFWCKWVCKPGSVSDSHLSMRTVAGALKPPPKSRRAGVAKIAALSTVLLRIEFTATDTLEPSGGRLSPPFHPYRQTPAVYLCCTFPEVAFGGRYPLSLPCGARTFLTHGLSACARGCPTHLLCYCTLNWSVCQFKLSYSACSVLVMKSSCTALGSSTNTAEKPAILTIRFLKSSGFS